MEMRGVIHCGAAEDNEKYNGERLPRVHDN